MMNPKPKPESDTYSILGAASDAVNSADNGTNDRAGPTSEGILREIHMGHAPEHVQDQIAPISSWTG